MATEKTVSFAEIVQGRDSSVRVTDDGMLYAVDLAMVMTGKDRDYAGQVLRRLSDETFHSAKFVERQLSTHGAGKTKLVSLEDAIELVMVLPGKKANHIRKQFANIIVRYIDGDRSMCSEIIDNQVMGRTLSCIKFAKKITKQIEKKDSKRTDMLPQVSYIYGTKSKAFPGLIKIGRSVDVVARLSSLNTGCAPAPHVIVAVAPTYDAKRDEALAHNFFGVFRQEGEFFQVAEEEVKSFFSNHIMTQYQTELAQCISKAQGDC